MLAKDIEMIAAAAGDGQDIGIGVCLKGFYDLVSVAEVDSLE